MAITVDNTLLPAALVDLITAWGWRGMVEHFELWSGNEENVKRQQVRRFYATLTNPAQGDNADTFMNFFNGRFGSAYGFLLEFPEYVNLTSQFLGTGDGTTVDFQAQMNIGDATRPLYHPLTRIKTGTTTVYVNAVADGGATVDLDTGIMTLSTASGTSGQPITADFSPYMAMRFETDDLLYQHLGNDVFSSNITMVEVIE